MGTCFGTKRIQIEIVDPKMTRCPTVLKGTYSGRGVQVKRLLKHCGGSALHEADTKKELTADVRIGSSCRLIRTVEKKPHQLACDCGGVVDLMGSWDAHTQRCYWHQSGLVEILIKEDQEELMRRATLSPQQIKAERFQRMTELHGVIPNPNDGL